MSKNFDSWNNIKKTVNELDVSRIYFNEREIWWCYFGLNVGHEQDGRGLLFLRPVLIYKKFTRDLCWAIPLSTKVLKGNFFFPLLSETNVIRTAILPQMKLIDVRRLRDWFDSISKKEHDMVKEKITAFTR